MDRGRAGSKHHLLVDATGIPLAFSVTGGNRNDLWGSALDSFDRRRPFGPWLHRIVVNHAIDWARARALRREVGDEQLAVVPAREDAPAEDLSNQTMTALAGLSPDHRAVVVLRYVLDYSPGEIAELLELPRGTVNSRLRRGLDALQEHAMREQP